MQVVLPVLRLDNARALTLAAWLRGHHLNWLARRGCDAASGGKAAEKKFGLKTFKTARKCRFTYQNRPADQWIYAQKAIDFIAYW